MEENLLIQGFSEFGKEVTLPYQSATNKTGKAFEY